MELDELKLAWKSLDRRMEALMTMNQQELLKEKRGKAASKLRPLAWGQSIQMIIGAIIVLLSVSFWHSTLEIPHLFFAGLSLHIYGVVLVIFGGAMHGMMSRVDYSAPVINIQKQLAKTRRFYVLASTTLGLVWWLLWIPLMMVAFAWAFNVDIYAHQPFILWSWVIIGCSGLLASLGFIYWASKRPILSSKLERSAAGKSLNTAQAFLDEIAEFEKA